MAESRGSRTKSIAGAVVLALVAVTFTPGPAGAASGTTTMASVASDGTQGTLESRLPAISGDGHFVAFGSSSSNFVAGDTNGKRDIFLRDMQNGVTSRVNVASDGTQANDDSGTGVSLSADGRYAAFSSAASNLVAGDTNGVEDVFVRDRKAGATTRVSVASDGTPGDRSSMTPDITPDGRYVTFQSGALNLVPGDTNQFVDIFVHDRLDATTTRVSLSSAPVQQGLGSSSEPSISADGRVVAFTSAAPNLIIGDTNAVDDVFVHDRQSATTTRVSVATGGSQGAQHHRGPAISAGGRHVAFSSQSNNLAPGDTNITSDVFVHDRQSAATSRASVTGDGGDQDGGAGGALSADGRYVTFVSDKRLLANDANNAHDVFLRDMQAGLTTRLSVDDDNKPGDGFSNDPDISADGRYVAFESLAQNLTPGDVNNTYDVFVRDTQGVAGPTPALVGVGDVSLYEGDAGSRAAVFTVSLTKPAATAVTVDYTTVDGSAVAGADYTAKTGTLSFAPGTTSLPVKVPVIADGSDEADETFTLSLSGANAAAIADSSGTATILDDDPAAVTGRRLAIGNVTVHEGDVGSRVAVFNVGLSTPASSTVSVNYATVGGSAAAGADYTAKTGTLSFAPGTTSLSVKVIVTPDIVAEGNHSFTLSLSGVSGAKTAIFDGTGQATIVDND